MLDGRCLNLAHFEGLKLPREHFKTPLRRKNSTAASSSVHPTEAGRPPLKCCPALHGLMRDHKSEQVLNCAQVSAFGRLVTTTHYHERRCCLLKPSRHGL